MMKVMQFICFAIFGLVLGSAAWGLQPQQTDSGSASQTPGDTGQQQGRRAGRMRRGAQSRKGMAELAQKLNLTDEQKSQFQKIRQNSLQQAKAIRSDSSLSDEQKKQKMADLRKDSHQQMFAVLTPEQKEKLKQMREEHKKEMQGNEGSGQQSSMKKSGNNNDDDPFAGMTSDDDEGGGRA
jgi:periplasmic protein CpxP/Spy